MMSRSFMYHLECPEGMIFADEEVPALEARGWVDTPAKLRADKATERGGDQSRHLALVDAIGKLDAGNKEHFTDAGLPRVEALEAAAGIIEVTAKERNAAFAAYNEAAG